MNRVSSLREVASDNLKRSNESILPNSVRAERRRSNSINDIKPMLKEGEEGGNEAQNISERIRAMQERCQSINGDNNQSKSPDIQKSRVSALKANFESSSSPSGDSPQMNAQKTNSDLDPVEKRYQQLKNNLANVVDIAAIEEKVSLSQRSTPSHSIDNQNIATLKEIQSKKLSLESINDNKIVDSLKGKIVKKKKKIFLCLHF